ncbi:hypothetical protein DFP72DRAFT_838419, partial [Ephemerocybe angulata]
IIPLDVLPSSAFFLLSQSNFASAWPEWLLPGLQARQYDLRPLHENGHLKEEIYAQVLHQLEDRGRRDKDNFSAAKPLNEKALLVFRRTLKFRALQRRPPSAHVNLHPQSYTRPCEKCMPLGAEAYCVKEVIVKVQEVPSELLGCGVSTHPKEEVINTLKGRSQGKGAAKDVKHPKEDLNLQVLEPDHIIIGRCGIQIYRIVDEKKNLLDIWAYGAIPKDLLEEMQRHHADLPAGLKGLVRGSQFAHYSQGKMVPQGERTPSGGAPGDCHRFYSDMNATELDSLGSLFDQAEDSFIISQVTRIIAFPIFQDVREKGQEGERLGTLATTLYHCVNYGAPVHKDRDAGKGLCANILKEGSKKEDYAFFNMAYRIMFIAQTNSLWSFTGTDPHGTVLPSLRPPKEIMMEPEFGEVPGPLPPPRNITKHVTKPKKNAISARKYLSARQNRYEHQKAWEIHV